LANKLDLTITRPNVARAYDAAMGGRYNSAEDRKIEEMGRKLFPHLSLFARFQRQFLFYIAGQIGHAGLNHVIDLGSGLPTQGALHEHLPQHTKVLYNDHDPETIALARYIIRDHPDIRYVQCKIEDTATVLAAAEELFEDIRRVCITLIGVAYFINDADLARVCQELYRWSAPGSMLAISFFNTDEHDPSWADIVKKYQGMGVQLYPRSAAHMLSLLGPWQADVTGIRPIEEFVEMGQIGTLAAPPEMRGTIGFAGVFTHP
jgi:SAM-dependent methyltransferase